MFEQIKEQAENAVRELLEVSKLQPGELLVIGCSSSEIMGERIGKGSSMEAARAVNCPGAGGEGDSSGGAVL